MVSSHRARVLNLPCRRHPELPERDRRILGVLVQAYIDHGEPVSSLWLAQPRLWCVVGDAPQRAGAARRAGLRAAAAHLGRTGADRPRLPSLRRSAAGRATRLAQPRRRSRPGCGARHRRRSPVPRVAGSLARLASGRLRDRAGGRDRRRSSTWTSCRSTAARSWSSSCRPAGTSRTR